MSPEIDSLIALFAKLPGLGKRSAKRIVLELLTKKAPLLPALIEEMQEIKNTIQTCSECYGIDVQSPCSLCSDYSRDKKQLCIVEKIDDLWAFERTKAFKGFYHILGGVLSPMDGVGPKELHFSALLERLKKLGTEEIVLALNATIESQTTLHYLLDILSPLGLKITQFSQGVPLGGELNFLDEGTLIAAFRARKAC